MLSSVTLELDQRNVYSGIHALSYKVEILLGKRSKKDDYTILLRKHANEMFHIFYNFHSPTA